MDNQLRPWQHRKPPGNSVCCNFYVRTDFTLQCVPDQSLHTFLLQAIYCPHAAAVHTWLSRSSTEEPVPGYGPIQLAPVHEEFPDVFYISQHEREDSKIAIKSKSKGRKLSHLFFVQGSHSCFVKVYPSKEEFRLGCQTSKGHWGQSACCCKRVYKVIQVDGDLLKAFPKLHDPSKYSSSRSYANSTPATPGVHVFPAKMPIHIKAGDCCNGLFEQSPSSEGPSCAHIKPQPPESQGEGESWSLVPDPAVKRTCTLITWQSAQPGYQVLMYQNTTTGETVTVGPSCGIFLATDPKDDEGYAYHLKVMYIILENLDIRRSNLEIEYKLLRQNIEDCARYRNQKCKIPSQQQFYKHFHRFRNSLVRYLCILQAFQQTRICVCMQSVRGHVCVCVCVCVRACRVHVRTWCMHIYIHIYIYMPLAYANVWSLGQGAHKYACFYCCC